MAQMKYARQINFFTNVEIFNRISKTALKQLFKRCQLITSLNQGKILYKEGDEATKIYIVRKGSVEISMKFLKSAKLKKMTGRSKVRMKMMLLNIQINE